MSKEEKLIERLEQIENRTYQVYMVLLQLDQQISMHLSKDWIEQIKKGREALNGADQIIEKTLKELKDDQNSDLSD